MRFALPNDQVDAIVRDLGLLLSLFPEQPRQFGSTYRAKCPIHGGERLSVGIKQGNDGWIFSCFACGAHGDAIHLVRQLDGCGFKEALERLRSGDRRPSVALWAAPKPKAFVLPCEGKGCGERLELDAIDLAVVDVAHPSWRFDKKGTIGHRQWRALCPRCSLKLAQGTRGFGKERSGHGPTPAPVVAGPASEETRTGSSPECESPAPFAAASVGGAGPNVLPRSAA